MKSKTVPALLLVFVLSVILIGCGPSLRFRPAASAQAPGSKYTGYAKSGGVEIRVTPNVWPGDLPIRQRITPVKVSITNRSGKPLRVRYQDFHFIDAGGMRRAAIPPHSLQGSVNVPVTVRAYPAFAPRFYHHGFYVAPHYGRYYPRMAFYHGPFGYDPFYWERHYTYWERVALPTPSMLEWAIPEGVIEPNGRVTGYLYFQKVQRQEGEYAFEMNLVHPQGKKSRALGKVRVPFIVK